MGIVTKATNQGTPFQEEPYYFINFGNIVPPYIVTLTLLNFIMGLLEWFFSTLMVLNAPDVTHDFGHSGDVSTSDVFKLPQGLFA
jgi:hypothetical protein